MTHLNGTLTNPFIVDTNRPATDTNDYVATDGSGFAATNPAPTSGAHSPKMQGVAVQFPRHASGQKSEAASEFSPHLAYARVMTISARKPISTDIEYRVPDRSRRRCAALHPLRQRLAPEGDQCPTTYHLPKNCLSPDITITSS